MKIISWNVNGIRAVATKGFAEFLTKENPDVLCLQETKAFLDQVPKDIRALPYHIVWHDGVRPGYAGTAIFSKNEPDASRTTFPKFEKFHEDGRVTETTFGDVTLLNIYFPNGGTRADGTEMLSYKLAFYDDLETYISVRQKKGEHFIIVGDFNIAHTEIDIARPKENETSIGFLPEERERLSSFMKKLNLVDTFRHFNPDETDNYTWWNVRTRARDRNIGWRIDYAMISHALLPRVKKIEHLHDVFGSDHCPVVIELK